MFFEAWFAINHLTAGTLDVNHIDFAVLRMLSRLVLNFLFLRL
jgi:hypothetical protein